MVKKLIKICAILIIASFMLVVLSGCKSRPSGAKLDKNAIKMFEDIFEDEFELVSADSSGWGEFGTSSETLRKLILTSKKYKEKDIYFSYSYNRDSKQYELLATNYNFVRYENRINKALNIILNMYPDYYVDIDDQNGKVVNCSYEDYMKTYNRLYIKLYLAPSVDINKRDKDIEGLRMLLKGNKIHVGDKLEVFYIKNDELYNKVKKEKNYIYNNHYEESGNYLRGTFEMDNNYMWNERSNEENIKHGWSN